MCWIYHSEGESRKSGGGALMSLIRNLIHRLLQSRPRFGAVAHFASIELQI